MTDEARTDRDADDERNVHGPEEGDRPDDAVEYEPGEVGQRHNDDADRQLSTEDEDDGRGRE